MKTGFTISKAEQGRALSPAEASSPWRRAIIPIAVTFFALQAIGTAIAIANQLPYLEPSSWARWLPFSACRSRLP